MPIRAAADPAARIAIVDYLRGVAALSVAWFHLTGGMNSNWAFRTGTYSWLGVEVFFVISGFAVTYALLRHEAVADFRAQRLFILRRVVRLEPPYIASVILCTALLYLSARAPGFRGETPHVTLPQLAFHLGYLIPLTSYEWLNIVYWTLTFEFAFYLIMAALFPLLAGPRGRMWFLAGAAIVVLSVATGILSPLALLFVTGIAVCRYRLHRDTLPITAAVSLIACGTMAAVGSTVEAAAGIATAVVIAAPIDTRRFPAALTRILASLGSISYSLYLIHVPIGGRVVNLGNRFVHGTIGQIGLALLALAVSLAAAWIFWWVFERPALRWARALRRRETSWPV